MSSIAQLQLVEYLILLVVSHLSFRLLAPKLDIPFLGISAATITSALFFAFLPPNRIVWLLIILFTIASGIYIFIIKHKNSTETTKDIGKKLPLSFIAWPVAIFTTGFLLASTLIFTPTNNRPEATSVSARDKLMVQLFQGEDNFTHVNLLQAINKTGKSTYFSSTTEWNENLIPGVSSYPQLVHTAASNVKVAVHDVIALTNQSNPDVTSTLWSYVLTHFFLMGCTIGLAASAVVSVLRKFSKIKDIYAFSTAIIFSVFAMRILMYPIVSWGFFSQSAGLIGIFLMFLIETSNTFNEFKDANRWQAALIRIVPIIIVGQSWSPLLMLLVPFLGIRLLPDYWKAFKTKKLKKMLLPTSILVIGSLFALLPTYVLLFVYDSDPLDVANLKGGIQYISIVNIIIYSAIATAIAFISLFALPRTKTAAHFAIFLFTLFACTSLTTIAVYQKKSENHFSYYSYKLAWSVAWIPSIALFILLGFVFYFALQLIERIKYINITMVLLFAISALIGICAYILVDIVSTQAIALSRGTNALQLADMASAVEKADAEGKILIVISDCSGYSDYQFQKAVSTLQGRWTPESFNFAVEEISSTDKDSLRKKFLEANPDKYNVIDLTPIADSSSPSDRIHVEGMTFDRTNLYQPWDTETLTSQCQLDAVPTTPTAGS